MIKKFFAAWKVIAILALFFILFTFLAEIFLHLEEGQRHLLELLDLVAIGVLVIDLGIHYSESKQKKGFVKRNWLLILSFLPFGSILRFVKTIKSFGTLIANYASKGFHLLTHSTKFMRAYRLIAVWSNKGKKRGKKRGKNRDP